MRINPNPLPDLLSELALNQQQINTDLEQIASGKSVNLPSDDPAAAALLVRNANQTSTSDQFLRSVGSIQGEMQNADSTLSQVITALQRAISLGVEGANGTLNDSDRAAIATEVQGIQGEMLNFANLSFQGNYVFAGSETQTAPYVLDPSAPSGVRYVGNNVQNSVTVGDHFTLQSNLPRSQLFSAAGADVFQGIQDLITNLQSGTGISSAVDELSQAYNHVNTQRVFFGNAINQLQSQQNYLNGHLIQLSDEQSSLGGADLASVMSNLATSQTGRQATLQAIAKVGQTNLFDYLK